MINKRINLDGYLENRRISLELALFTDGGIFYNNGLTRKIADAGVGVRLGSTIFNKPLYLRLDFPFILFKNNKIINNHTKWVVSFHRGI